MLADVVERSLYLEALTNVIQTHRMRRNSSRYNLCVDSNSYNSSAVIIPMKLAKRKAKFAAVSRIISQYV